MKYFNQDNKDITPKAINQARPVDAVEGAHPKVADRIAKKQAAHDAAPAKAMMKIVNEAFKKGIIIRFDTTTPFTDQKVKTAKVAYNAIKVNAVVSTVATSDNTIANIKVATAPAKVMKNMAQHGDTGFDIDYAGIATSVTEYITSSVSNSSVINLDASFPLDNMTHFVEHGIVAALKSSAKALKGDEIFKSGVINKMADRLTIVALMEIIATKVDEKEANRVSDYTETLMANRQAAYLAAYHGKLVDMVPTVNEKGYNEYEMPVNNDYAIKLSELIFNEFVESHDILMSWEETRTSRSGKEITRNPVIVNPDLVDGLVETVIKKSIGKRVTGVVIGDMPMIDGDFSIGSPADVIGSKVKMNIGTKLGDNTRTIEALNNLSQVKLVINTDFLAIAEELQAKLDSLK